MSRGRLRLLQAVDERTWREQVLRWATRNGWRPYFTWKSINSPAGFPDLVLVRPPRVIFVELKTETGQLSDAQGSWITDLCGCESVETFVWRPHDEALVVEVLK